MGLLDMLQGDPSQASPYSALFPSPLLQQLQQMQLATGQAPNPQDAAAFGAMGVDPSSMMQPTPPESPFPAQQPQPQAPPASGFGAGATPFSFAGPGANVVSPSQIAPPAPPAAAPAPAMPPAVANANAAPTPPQNAPIPVGNVMMPRIGSGFPAPGADDEEDDAPAAKPAAAPAAAPSGPAPFSFGGVASNIGDRLDKAGRGFFGNMALGPIGALAGGLGALVSNRNTDPTAIAQEKMNATAHALLKKGAGVDEIQAASQNPELMKALIGQYFGQDKWKVVQTGETPLGKTFQLYNQADGTFKPIPGGAGGAGAGGPASSNLPANFDPKTRRDDAYIASLDPTTREVVEAADRGDNIPQGRNLQKYMPIIQRAIQGFDPSQYQAKMAFNREMGSGKSGYGFQVKGFQQGLNHMSGLADSYLGAGNYNGLGFPDLAHAANTVREHASNDQSAKALGIENVAQTLAGEVGKLFSGSQGGGVHEREATRGRFNSRLSGPEAAAALESTLEMMQGGLSSIEQARDRAYGRDASDKYNFVGQQQQQQIDHIKQVIQQLRSGTAAPSAASPGAAPALPSGWSVKVN